MTNLFCYSFIYQFRSLEAFALSTQGKVNATVVLLDDRLNAIRNILIEKTGLLFSLFNFQINNMRQSCDIYLPCCCILISVTLIRCHPFTLFIYLSLSNFLLFLYLLLQFLLFLLLLPHPVNRSHCLHIFSATNVSSSSLPSSLSKTLFPFSYPLRTFLLYFFAAFFLTVLPTIFLIFFASPYFALLSFSLFQSPWHLLRRSLTWLERREGC